MNKKLIWQDHPTVAGFYYLLKNKRVLIVEVLFSADHMWWRDINSEGLSLVKVDDGKWAGPIEIPE